MEQIVNPYLFYAAIALGGVGLCLALPRKGLSPQVIGLTLGAAGVGLALLALALHSPSHLPNIYFYVFAAVALGGALRVVTHPRPVYAALYFILTVIASSGLFLLLSAEFMAFAMIIVYAGAILITYLFVIMLASQPSSEDAPDELAPYDTASREPIAASIAGFAMLALLTTMVFRGLPSVPEPPPGGIGDEVLAAMPRKLERELRTAQPPVLLEGERFAQNPDGSLMISPSERAVVVITPEGTSRIAPWPEGLRATNVEELGFVLLARHPGTIEIAGVILLMAMLGAVVLSRRQVQLDEEAKLNQARRLAGLVESVSVPPGDSGPADVSGVTASGRAPAASPAGAPVGAGGAR